MSINVSTNYTSRISLSTYLYSHIAKVINKIINAAFRSAAMRFRSLFRHFLTGRSCPQRRDLVPRGKEERQSDKKTHETQQNVTRGWKRAKSHSASWILAAICTIHAMPVCVRTCGMVPRYVIECFIHKRRTKPVCLS